MTDVYRAKPALYQNLAMVGEVQTMNCYVYNIFLIPLFSVSLIIHVRMGSFTQNHLSAVESFILE